MNSEKNIHEIIVKVFSGEASIEENLLVEKWRKKNAENEQFFSNLKKIWEDSEKEADQSYNVDKAIKRFLVKTGGQKSKPQIQINRILRYAAVFIFAATIPFIYWYLQKPEFTDDAYTTIHSAYGDKTEVVLPDSSVVWLNSGSQLSFLNDFKNNSRSVTLEGEAYFSVRKDNGNPFTVSSKYLKVKVFGTEFNVKAYAEEKEVSVTLVEGSVQVSHSDNEEMMVPGQKFILDKDTETFAMLEPEDLAPDIEWINGKLVFRNQSLMDLELKLERWFDVEIEFKDELVKTRRFSGTLERESILEVISYFGVSQFVDYSIDGNVITFFSENS